MKKIVSHADPGRTSIAAALLLACSLAQAQDAPVVERSADVGAALVSGDSADRSIYGQYNGYRRGRAYGLLDLDYYRRDDEAGRMTRFRGRNLLGETRELDFVWKRQGQWQFRANYDEIVRHEPYRINSGLLGAGSTDPQVVHLGAGPGTGSIIEPSTRRRMLSVAYTNNIREGLQFDANVSSENKDGSRLFGRGFNCPTPLLPGCATSTGISAGWATLMLPEPIDLNHTQLDARLSHAAGKLRLSGGYYGSFLDNANGSLSPGIPGSLNGALGNPMPLAAGLQPALAQAIALAPSNEAHHFDVAGNYLFTPTTRGMFKLGYSRALQNQDFSGAGLSGAPAGVANLGGSLDTTLVHLGLRSRPVNKLTLIADLRFEDRDDNTPIRYYNVVGSDIMYTNRNYSRTRLRGKLQASYQFTGDYRGMIGIDHDAHDRGAFARTSWVRGVSALRDKTEETTYRAELRRRMTEDLSGAVTLSTARRGGSNWSMPNAGPGITEAGDGSGFAYDAVFMPSLADRRRDKLRLSANWQPTEALSLQFSVDQGRDRYELPSGYGLNGSAMSGYTFDADYAFDDDWRLNAYLSLGDQKIQQSRAGGAVMTFDNRNATLGLGVNGKPTGKLEVGAVLSVMNDRNIYSQVLDAYADANSAGLLAASGGLPDIVFRLTELRLYAGYKLSPNSSLRADLVHHRAHLNDWAYGYAGVPFVFSDNTTLLQQQRQQVSFIGLRYIYRWK
jgi:MtrB/PioB family decaheme-associated outer membrane protein